MFTTCCGQFLEKYHMVLTKALLLGYQRINPIRLMPNNLNVFQFRCSPMCKVLLIDDEQMILRLRRAGPSANELFGGDGGKRQDGIDKFDSGRFDLVITDVCMPETDGNRVVHHIRNSSRKHTPVIGMSGTPWKLADHKFDGVLPKPFQIDCLIEAARALTSPVC
jgi:CheY-like chemotaxis protein